MKLKFEHEMQQIEFEVVRRKRKTLCITIRNLGVIVFAPMRMSSVEILKIVKTKAGWIIKKLVESRAKEAQKYERHFGDGDKLLYFGKDCQLNIVAECAVKKPIVTIYDDEIFVQIKEWDREAVKIAIEKWYRQKAQEKICERIKHFQQYLSVYPVNIKIKAQEKRWGSCTAKGNLNFNWRIIMAPPDVIDYIVVHEMCHLVHLDHSSNFWGLVRKIMPEYKSSKMALKNMGFKYRLE